MPCSQWSRTGRFSGSAMISRKASTLSSFGTWRDGTWKWAMPASARAARSATTSGLGARKSITERMPWRSTTSISRSGGIAAER